MSTTTGSPAVSRWSNCAPVLSVGVCLALNHRITIQMLVRSAGLNSPNGPPIGGLELSSGRCSGPGTGTGSQLRLRAPDHVEPWRRPPGTVVAKSILEDRLGLRQRGGFPAAAPGL